MSDPLRQCEYGTPGHQPCVACSHEVAIRTLAAAQERLHMPGAWCCPICGFVVNKRILRAADGAVAVNDRDESELCPNDGATLRRITWQEQAGAVDEILRKTQERLRDVGGQWDRLTRILLAAEGDDLCEVVAAIVMERDGLHRRLAQCVEALEKITAFAPGNGDVCEVIARIARAALDAEEARQT